MCVCVRIDRSVHLRLINLKRRVLHLAGTKNSSWTDRCRKSGRFEIAISSFFYNDKHETRRLVGLLSIKRADKHETAFTW